MSAEKRKAEEMDTLPKRVGNGQVAFMEDGFPVFKVGFDKFLAVRLNTTNKDATWLYYVLGEWKLTSTGWQMTEKILRMSAGQFHRFIGLVMSGRADLKKDEEDRPLLHLGHGLYFTWAYHNRSFLATIRNFHMDGSGDMVPTKRGTTFGMKCYQNLKTLFMDGQLFKEMARIKAGNPKEGLGYDKLKVNVAKMLVELVGQARSNTCGPCQMPDSKEPHICNNKVAPTEEEWILAESVVVKNKCVEAYLLVAEKLSPGQLVSLEVAKFLADNRDAMRTI
jgi:hypothetical protein